MRCGIDAVAQFGELRGVAQVEVSEIDRDADFGALRKRLCGGTQQGGSSEAGGEKVPAPADAAYDTYTFDVPFLGQVEVMSLVISAVPDFCETWDGFVDNASEKLRSSCQTLL